MVLINFDWRLKREDKKRDARDPEENGGDPRSRMLETNPRGKCRQTQGYQAGG